MTELPRHGIIKIGILLDYIELVESSVTARWSVWKRQPPGPFRHGTACGGYARDQAVYRGVRPGVNDVRGIYPGPCLSSEPVGADPSTHTIGRKLSGKCKWRNKESESTFQAFYVFTVRPCFLGDHRPGVFRLRCGKVWGVAVAKGIVDGYPDGSFRPLNFVRRDEAAAMIARMLGLGT